MVRSRCLWHHDPGFKRRAPQSAWLSVTEQLLHAVIQAGGLGRRIAPASGDTPKPLLQVGGMSMVERLLCQLADAGLREFTVVLGRAGSDIRTRLLQKARDLNADLNLAFHVEETPLGNAGALARIDAEAAVLFAFADLVTDLDFRKLLVIHRERGCDVTLTSHYEHHQLTLGELLTEGDRVRGYQEKPRKRFLICSGIVVLEPAAMRVARSIPTPYGLSDLINATLHGGCTVTHWLHEAYWIDVNTPELLARARQEAMLDAAARTPAPGARAAGADR